MGRAALDHKRSSGVSTLPSFWCDPLRHWLQPETARLGAQGPTCEQHTQLGNGAAAGFVRVARLPRAAAARLHLLLSYHRTGIVVGACGVWRWQLELKGSTGAAQVLAAHGLRLVGAGGGGG